MCNRVPTFARVLMCVLLVAESNSEQTRGIRPYRSGSPPPVCVCVFVRECGEKESKSENGTCEKRSELCVCVCAEKQCVGVSSSD